MKQPPTDPPPRPPSPSDPADASARQVRQGHPSTDASARGTPPKRPSGHGSYRLSDHSVPERYDDGVVHQPHYDADGHDDLHNVDTAHEHSDVNIRGVIASAIILAVITIVSQIAMYFLFERLEGMAAAHDPQVSPLASPPIDMPKTTRETPYFSTGVGGPRLLSNEPMALHEQRAKEAKQLQEYGWVSQSAGVAHIPIDEAKKLILERGLPVREGNLPGPMLGTRLPAAGESSGGRVITETLPDRPADAPSEQKPAEAAPHKPGGH